MRLLDDGRCERLKAWVHGGIAVLTSAAALYNGVKALSAEGDWENTVNAGVYTLIALTEARRTRRHWSRRETAQEIDAPHR